MKTLQEINQQEPIFLHDWSETKLEGLIKDFEGLYGNEIPQEIQDKYSDLNILFASYTYESYSGDAFVLLAKGNDLFQVNGSHCSCYGLENQFDLEPTSLEAIKTAILQGSLGKNDWCGNQFNSDLIKFLGI